MNGGDVIVEAIAASITCIILGSLIFADRVLKRDIEDDDGSEVAQRKKALRTQREKLILEIASAKTEFDRRHIRGQLLDVEELLKKP
jgi:hypothetical protein